MIFSGNNFLYLPQVQQHAFAFKDIIVDCWTPYSVAIDVLTGVGDTNYSKILSTINLFQLNSGSIYNNVNKIIGSYNTGENFDVEGWIDSIQNKLYLEIDGSAILDTGFFIGDSFGTLYINCTGKSILNCSVAFSGIPINYNLTLPSTFSITNGSVTGELLGNVNGMIFQSSSYFYNSNEQLLDTQGPVIAFAYANENLPIAFLDSDTSTQGNFVQGILNLFPIYGDLPINLSSARSMPTGSIFVLTSLNDAINFGGDFDGTWANNTFTYQDVPSVTILNYSVINTDAWGNPQPVTLNLNFNLGVVSQYSYITGFNLTNSGLYSQPPNVAFTGYYYVTGIQQNLISILLSSGCTGNVPVSFTPIGSGAGATGFLTSHAVSFLNVYTSGINTYYVIDSYQSLGFGSGYTQSPTAVIHTGIYGTTCYDVPRVYGFNQAWFTPFSTQGTISPSATYLTGTALWTTGLLTGGQTGYFITGLDIYNLGSGYSNVYPPKVSFIRTQGDSCIGDASGVLLISSNTGVSNATNFSTVDFQIGNNDWILGNTGQYSGIVNLTQFDNTISLRITVSGFAASTPTTGGFITINPTGLMESIIFAHTFDTDSGALKKNFNFDTGTQFVAGSDLSFLLTQDDLDSIYSNANFTNNGSFDIGDLDF